MTQLSAAGGSYDPQVDPGVVNPPAIFEPSTDLSVSGAPEVWVAASGGANWGGAVVSISFDGVTYSYIGTLTSAAFQGTLTAALAAASGLDNTNTLAIDLTESAGVLPTAATHADADAKRTLCYLCAAYSASGGAATVPGTGELLAYGAVAATGTYTNNLIYLQRGLYGTTGSSHASGDFFTRLDLGEVNTPPNSIVAWALPPQYIGAALHLKLQSFNVFGNALEDIAAVIEYSYTPSGSGYGGGGNGVPTTPATPTGYGFGNYAALQWAANPAGDHVTGYSILRRLSGVGSYTQIGTTTTTSYNDYTVLSSTNYDYEIEAVNAAGTSLPSLPVTINIP